MTNTDKPPFSVNQAFDELEQLIASELVDLDDWDDDINDLELDALNTSKRELPAAITAATHPRDLTYETIDGGHGLRLRLNGNIGFHSRPAIMQLISDIRSGTTKHYDLDFTDVAAISLIGMSLLTLLIDAIGARNIELTLSNCPSGVYHTLCWAGLNKKVLVAHI